MKQSAAWPLGSWRLSKPILPLKTTCFGLLLLVQTMVLFGAGVSQTTFQGAVDKLNEGQTFLEVRLRALQSRFEDYLRTNTTAGVAETLTPAQITALAQSTTDNFVRSLDLGAKMELVKERTVRDSVWGVSNALHGFETNLLNAVRSVLATNPPRVIAGPVGLTNALEGSSGQFLNGLQTVSKQVATLRSTVTTLQARMDHRSRQSYYLIIATGLTLLIAAAATSFLVWSRSAAVTHLVNQNLERNVQWFASNVECVAKAVNENLETQRNNMAEHLGSLKARCEATIDKHERTLRELNGEAVANLRELNSKLSNAGDEISTALRLYAGELTGNRLAAELNAATVLWKRSFDQTLVQEQTRGQGCLQQLREEADGEFRKALNHQNQQAQIVTRECVDLLRSQFQDSLCAEMDSARKTWARHIEEEQQALARQLGGLVQQQAETLRQSLETTAQSTQRLFESQLSQFKGQADQTLQGIQRDLTTSRKELEAIHQNLGTDFERLKERDEAFADLFWPGCLKHGALSGWRERIQAGAIRREPAAIELMLALGRFNNLAPNFSDLRKVAEALHAVSQDAYRFWKTTGAKVLDASQEWKAAFQTALDTNRTPLDIMLVLEGERFDMNTMLVAGDGSAGRIVVREVLSWIVRDKSGPVAKVLCHGWVTAA